MLRSECLHPEILEALGAAGHGSLVLIADSNYPFSTGAHAGARRVYLNLAPGLLTVTDVLRVLAATIPVEAARGIAPDEGPEPAIFNEYRALLPDVKIGTLGRYPFYETARSQDTALVIATGERRTWACLLLTIGVVETT